MFTRWRVRLQAKRLEDALEWWRSIPIPPNANLHDMVPAPDVLTAEQFAGLAGVREDVARAFLESKAAEFGIEGESIYFQGGPYWIEYQIPKK